MHYCGLLATCAIPSQWCTNLTELKYLDIYSFWFTSDLSNCASPLKIVELSGYSNLASINRSVTVFRAGIGSWLGERQRGSGGWRSGGMDGEEGRWGKEERKEWRGRGEEEGDFVVECSGRELLKLRGDSEYLLTMGSRSRWEIDFFCFREVSPKLLKS